MRRLTRRFDWLEGANKMIKIYAVIDTNVLVSALLSRFKNTSTVQLLQLLILGDITPIYNDEI